MLVKIEHCGSNSGRLTYRGADARGDLRADAHDGSAVLRADDRDLRADARAHSQRRADDPADALQPEPLDDQLGERRGRCPGEERRGGRGGGGEPRRRDRGRGR